MERKLGLSRRASLATAAATRFFRAAHGRGADDRWAVRKGALTCAALLCVAALMAVAGPAMAESETVTLSATETVPVPPASHFAGSGGGDGWAVALSSERVYNVFHHDPSALTVACHLQADATVCPGWPKTISEPGGSAFTSQAQPGMYLDQQTGKLYVYTTRLSDRTGGVLCVETTSAAADPYCGFTALTGTGEAPLTANRSISGMSNPMLIGTHLYSFNFAGGEQSGTQDELSCFDVSTDQSCASQPYAVALPAGQIETTTNEPVGETAAIAGKAIIPLNVNGQAWLACFDDATQSTCAGKWPINQGHFYNPAGAPFPLLDGTGKTIGLCVPDGTDPCFDLEGESVATPEHMSEVIPRTEEWNGPALVLGPRVYVPNGETDEVDCFDYSSGKSCVNFPKQLQNLELLYTVNPDPQRPTCIWVNSDGEESGQIQSFDAYTGQACGEGAIRVLASQFVAHHPECTPISYQSLQVLKPSRGAYTSGSVTFEDGDGNSLGLPEATLDGNGATSLAGLNLNSATGLPQFLFSLNGLQEALGTVEVQLTWTAAKTASCGGVPATPKTTTTTTTATTTTTTAPAKTAVLAEKVVKTPAGKASAARVVGCVAGTSYLAAVHGTQISSVRFVLDGQTLKTVRHGPFALRLKLKAGARHHLSMHVAFTSASKSKAVTINRTIARCAAAKPVAKPRFTG